MNKPVKTTLLLSSELVELAREVIAKGGRLHFRTRGHSMFPSIADGDEVVIGPLDPGGPQIGQVVLVDTQSGPRLHRLIAKDADGKYFVARGDAELSAGDRIKADQIYARIVQTRRPLSRWLSPGFILAMLRTTLRRMGLEGLISHFLRKTRGIRK
ncbi:MAG: S24/S26 family peptidase [Deltaproteobacteria bacterium]|nr:S24/S26 family peptidase [Deltaproteobacteria bacterium]